MADQEEEEKKEPTEEEKMIEAMEDDRTLLTVNDQSELPMSNAYKATDLFNPQNINSSNPLTVKKLNPDPKKELTN